MQTLSDQVSLFHILNHLALDLGSSCLNSITVRIRKLCYRLLIHSVFVLLILSYFTLSLHFSNIGLHLGDFGHFVFFILLNVLFDFLGNLLELLSLDHVIFFLRLGLVKLVFPYFFEVLKK